MEENKRLTEMIDKHMDELSKKPQSKMYHIIRLAWYPEDYLLSAEEAGRIFKVVNELHDLFLSEMAEITKEYRDELDKHKDNEISLNVEIRRLRQEVERLKVDKIELCDNLRSAVNTVIDSSSYDRYLKILDKHG